MTLTSYGEAGGVETLTNYLEDDWDDDALTGRSNPNTGVFQEQLSGGVGDLLKGIYRPEWNVENGSPSATNQELQIPSGGTTVQALGTPSKQAVGAWTFDFQYPVAPTSSGLIVYFISLESQTTPDNGYDTFIKYDGSTYDLRVRSGGTNTGIISATWSGDTNLHTYKATRDEDGNLELFEDGASKGTGTDTTFDTSNFFVYRNSADDGVHVDNLAAN